MMSGEVDLDCIVNYDILFAHVCLFRYTRSICCLSQQPRHG
jgi:hypothetical protein